MKRDGVEANKTDLHLFDSDFFKNIQIIWINGERQYLTSTVMENSSRPIKPATHAVQILFSPVVKLTEHNKVNEKTTENSLFTLFLYLLKKSGSYGVSFMWGSYPASLGNVSGPTQVPTYAWNNAWMGHLKSSSTSKVRKSPYNVYSVGAN